MNQPLFLMEIEEISGGTNRDQRGAARGALHIAASATAIAEGFIPVHRLPGVRQLLAVVAHALHTRMDRMLAMPRGCGRHHLAAMAMLRVDERGQRNRWYAKRKPEHKEESQQGHNACSHDTAPAGNEQPPRTATKADRTCHGPRSVCPIVEALEPSAHSNTRFRAALRSRRRGSRAVLRLRYAQQCGGISDAS